MGKARVEIYRRGDRNSQYPGEIQDGPFYTAIETTSTTATVTGSRITVPAVPNYKKLMARITHDEICWVAVNTDPVTETAVNAWQTQPGIPLHIPVLAGDKFSFKEAA